MQQRRGTSEQWSTANPILAAGEIGYETDTNEFRIGDGVNRWADLSPFKNLADLGGTLDDYVPLTQKGIAGGVATLDQYGSIPVSQLPNADALDAEVDTKVSTHSALTQGIHGIDDTAELVKFADLNDAIDTEVTNRNEAIDTAQTDTYGSATAYTDTAISEEVIDRNDAIDASLTAANGYTDSEIDTLSSSLTTDIETAKEEAISAAADDATSKVTAEVTNRNNAISSHNSATTSVHGIADTAALATKVYADNAVSTHDSDTTSVHGIADTSALATKSYADNAVSTHEQDTTNIHGIADTSALATKTYADNAASTAVAAVIDAAPAALDTLNELAAALGDNANYATTVTNALALKAPLANPTFTGTVSGITKSMVGLGNVENTADADKPVSSAAQTALNLKAPKADPTFTGTVVLPSTTSIGNVSATEIGYLDGVTSAIQTQIDDKLASSTAASTYAPIANPTFTGTVSGVTKSMVGLGNVDNTSDANKIISTATQTALDSKLALAGGTLTGALTLSADPTSDLHAATKQYVDAAVNNINVHEATVAATTDNVNLTNAVDNNKTLDGVTIKTGDRILVKNQNTASQNGIYIVASNGAPTRAADYNAAGEVSSGDFIFVKGGTVNANTGWIQTADVTTVGTSDISFTQFSGAGTYTAGSGLTLTGTTFSIADGSITSAKIADGAIVDADVNASAAIAQSKISGLTSDLAAKAPLANPTFTGTVSGITKSMVGLGSVDNTSDAGKPVSTATQTALDLKAPLANPTFTGTVAGITKTMVGLGNVDNTSDASKPVSTATQTALDAKAPLASPALTGTPTAPTASAGTNTTQVATTAFVGTAVANLVASAPSTLDTLNELATALGNDASFSTTVTTNLGLKAPKADPTFTGTVTVSSSGVAFTDGTQTKEGVPSRTPIIQKTGSYTLSALSERDSMIEVSSATAVSITIPLNSAIAYPVGTSIDVLQTSTGQVSIVGTAGVTINAAPSGGANTAKLRTQWSSCTLFKRASDTWVVYGDLTA